MGHRLSKITTRTGDKGETGLGDGSRVSKDHARVAALGEIDELNSALGVLLAEELPAEIRGALAEVQQDLLDLGGELSIPGHSLVKPEKVAALEAQLEAWNRELPPLKEFILPGGSRAAAAAHLARTICRRAERSPAPSRSYSRSTRPRPMPTSDWASRSSRSPPLLKSSTSENPFSSRRDFIMISTL